MDNHKLVKDTYNKIAAAYSEKWSDTSEFLLSNLKKFSKLMPKNASVLDLGCGAGRDCQYFCEQGFSVWGVDFSPGMIAIAKKTAPKARFRLEDFNKINFKNNYFDGIWSFFSILHLRREEILPLFLRLNSFLRAKGTFFVFTKEGKGERIEAEHLNESLEMFETYFSKRELEDLLKKANFKIIESKILANHKRTNEKMISILTQKD